MQSFLGPPNERLCFDSWTLSPSLQSSKQPIDAMLSVKWVLHFQLGRTARGVLPCLSITNYLARFQLRPIASVTTWQMRRSAQSIAPPTKMSSFRGRKFPLTCTESKRSSFVLKGKESARLQDNHPRGTTLEVSLSFHRTQRTFFVMPVVPCFAKSASLQATRPTRSGSLQRAASSTSAGTVWPNPSLNAESRMRALRALQRAAG